MVGKGRKRRLGTLIARLRPRLVARLRPRAQRPDERRTRVDVVATMPSLQRVHVKVTNIMFACVNVSGC